MKTIFWILIIIVALVLGYWAFYLGLALLKIFLGLAVIALVSLAFWFGRISKK